MLPQEDHVREQITTEVDPLVDPEVGFVTPTQAGTLVATSQAAQQPMQHQVVAHQVPFNLDDSPHGLKAVHAHFNDLGKPYDPATEVGIPVLTLLPLDPSSLHDRFGDSASSDDNTAMNDALSFVKGSAMATSTSSPMTCFGSFVAGARLLTV